MTGSSARFELEGVAISPDHYVDGARLASATTFEDRSPLEWTRVLGHMARGDAGIANAALTSAARAFPSWAALSCTARGEYLHRLAELIDERSDQIARVECLDMAMREESLRLRVIPRGARNFRAYADLAVEYEERSWSSNNTDNRVVRMPCGPAVIITPWNAPFMLSTWKCAPALAAGNTVVLKPAEWSPLSASILADLIDEAGFPPGVFNIVQGIGEEIGAALVSDPRVRRVSFTGSPETGRLIGMAAARNLAPFTAELGGKSPLIVFADAYIDAAAKKAAGQYDDAGQVCLAVTRLLVEVSVRDEFLEKFLTYTNEHVLGDSRDDNTTISPVIHVDHLAQIDGFVQRARRCGDNVMIGGKIWREGGLWYEPTLIEPVSNNSEIVQKEVFGPVLTLQTFDSEAQAIELANSTPYGLAGMIYTTSAKRADRVGRAVRAGTVWVNCFLIRDLSAPFGGTGISGIGREGGDYALDFHSDLKTLQVLQSSVS